MANTGYQILKYTTDQADALSTRVAALAATGWLPQGGAMIDNGHIYQTMIKGDVGGAAGTGDVYTLPAATDADLGGVLQAANQADSVAADIAAMVVDFNTLLASLKAAGVMVAD